MKSLIAWVRREPVLASWLLDVVMVILGMTLHRWNLEVPGELRAVIYGFLVAVSTGTTLAARGKVTPIGESE